ncbi:peptidoglycan DD-metalloendopeptidase family protein [Bradyrhizobium sp. CSA112]|uniref:peptidoglycan DD-metalloendopeptidase family protein n=1 Tax=Bradyrhizobium sp. CSA112 TaxID=2699170 RepID=UPI0023AF7EA6|nr:peptidoglycan DD-metalloendopeptidase family protein [Bradyrhizobium sp. CSA112]MDE5454492.1 peptidoglycan DD-metalloendopeptidase family protein [Bradyrhizobium sp. CSA112]
MNTVAVRLLARWLAALCLLPAGVTGAAADEFRTPSITAVRVEWRAVVDQLRTEIGTRPAIASRFTFAGQRRVPAWDPRSTPALVQLNAINAPLFNGIGRSPVPVLLPFDTAGYLEGQAAGTQLPLSRYQADFRPADLFHAGPAGYDAVFSLPSGTGGSRTFAKPVEVQITGSILLYDLADPLGGKGEPVKALAAQFPDLRRFIREGYVRYAFTRFGVPYVVSVQCLDSAPRARRLACREAYPIAERFLKALRIAGGQPARPRHDISSEIAERPTAVSPAFTYYPGGDIISRSSVRRRGGRADFAAYSQIRFPLEKAPAAIRSQSFGRKRTESVYPWRDNFCEARSFQVGQCAAGFGHQGQDVRPAPCPPNSNSESACHPKKQAVVAVRDGIVIRAPKQQAATLQINTRNEHIRFRYMHMNPSAMDADGILSGRRVAEGEKIGVVSNYLDFPNGTSYHLHFDVQVFTRDGWIWVNPYTTLIASYERLIRGRGREIGTDPPAVAAMVHDLPADVLRRSTAQGRAN